MLTEIYTEKGRPSDEALRDQQELEQGREVEGTFQERGSNKERLRVQSDLVLFGDQGRNILPGA